MDQISTLLSKFDLDEKEIEIYLLLLKKKATSATEISKLSEIPKTTVYRALEKLQQENLISEVVDEHRRLYEAEPPENLKHKITEYEEKLKGLNASFPLILENLSDFAKTKPVDSKIKHYKGIEGLKQVTWNAMKTKEIFRIFQISAMNEFLNFGFWEKLRQTFVDNNVKTREITNEDVVEDWTNIKGFFGKHWVTRYIDPKELKMEYEILVYNDTVAMYNHTDGDIFCVEIYDARLARMQAQILDFLWLKGKDFKILSDKGAAKVIK